MDQMVRNGGNAHGPGRPSALLGLLRRLDLDLLGRELLGRRHADLQHSVLEGRFHFVCFHSLRDRHAPRKFAVGELLIEVILLFLFLLVLAFALDGQMIAHHRVAALSAAAPHVTKCDTCDSCTHERLDHPLQSRYSDNCFNFFIRFLSSA